MRTLALLLLLHRLPAPGAGPCDRPMTAGKVCEAANRRALALMRQHKVTAVTVVHDVHSGVLLVSAASQPATLDASSRILPLSVTKLMLAASWWDSHLPDASFVSSRGKAGSANPAYRDRVNIHEMLVGGSDSAGREMAIELRKAVGTDRVLSDLKRYGFPRHALSATTSDQDWADTLSIGEANIHVTAIEISRFLQAAGLESSDILQPATARQLRAAMLDTVKRGTARTIATAMKGGWQIGGKTGSGAGPDPNPAHPLSHGWFAGLVFDPQGKARFTVATFVRHGGLGSGHAARISVDLARYLTPFPVQ